MPVIKKCRICSENIATQEIEIIIPIPICDQCDYRKIVDKINKDLEKALNEQA